jgi:hypothetical protein
MNRLQRVEAAGIAALALALPVLPLTVTPSAGAMRVEIR